MAAVIEVRPNPALIDAETGEKHTTVQMTYATGFDGRQAFFWQRHDLGEWTRLELDDPMLTSTGDPDHQGTITAKVELGGIFEVLLYHDQDVDPNLGIGDPEPDARATTVGLLKGPRATDLVQGEEFGPTGTSFGWFPSTRVLTFATMQISRIAPEADLDGVLSFHGPLVGTAVRQDFSKNPSLEFASAAMLPGNPFHALVQVSDVHGNWQQQHIPFVLGKRLITVQLREIHIVDDGADGDNKARFSVWVMHGWHLQNRLDVPEQPISDSPSPGLGSEEFIDLTQAAGQSTVVILPHAVDVAESPPEERTDLLAILTHAAANESFGSDDTSGNFLAGPSVASDLFTGTVTDLRAFFDFPVGREQEIVDEAEFVVRAEPLTSGELVYDVTALISVSYG